MRLGYLEQGQRYVEGDTLAGFLQVRDVVLDAAARVAQLATALATADGDGSSFVASVEIENARTCPGGGLGKEVHIVIVGWVSEKVLVGGKKKWLF